MELRDNSHRKAIHHFNLARNYEMRNLTFLNFPQLLGIGTSTFCQRDPEHNLLAIPNIRRTDNLHIAALGLV